MEKEQEDGKEETERERYLETEEVSRRDWLFHLVAIVFEVGYHRPHGLPVRLWWQRGIRDREESM